MKVDDELAHRAEFACWYCGASAEYVEPDRYGDRPICFDHAVACHRIELQGVRLIDGLEDA